MASAEDSWDVAVSFCFGSFASAPWIFCSLEEEDDGENGIRGACLALLLSIRFEALIDTLFLVFKLIR